MEHAVRAGLEGSRWNPGYSPQALPQTGRITPAPTCRPVSPVSPTTLVSERCIRGSNRRVRTNLSNVFTKDSLDSDTEGAVLEEFYRPLVVQVMPDPEPGVDALIEYSTGCATDRSSV